MGRERGEDVVEETTGEGRRKCAVTTDPSGESQRKNKIEKMDIFSSFLFLFVYTYLTRENDQ